MEILLLQDIPGMGKKNDLLVVGDGYALNYLLPRRAALVATPLVRKRYADFIKRRAEEREKERSVAIGTVSAVSGQSVSFARKATKNGKLYAAITSEAIAEALHQTHNIDVAADAITIDEPIKSLGAHCVFVHIAGQDAPFTVEVIAAQ